MSEHPSMKNGSKENGVQMEVWGDGGCGNLRSGHNFTELLKTKTTAKQIMLGKK